MLKGHPLSTTLSRTSQPAPTFAQRIAWAILIALTLNVCYFSHLGVIGFVGPDEPRYAWIARDMAESGDWITPRLYGKPWFEKPPLLYWGGAVFFKLLGQGHPEVAARLPSAVCALLATLALAWLAWRTYGEECARWLLLLLPTSVGMIGFSHAAATDMPFAGMLTIAMICAAVVLGLAHEPDDVPILPYTPWLALLLFGFFLGLAVLAKGPAAIVLSGGAVFFWALFTKRWRKAFRLLHPAAVAAFCLTALPWYLLCAHRNPDFFRIFIIEHNFKRYLTPEFQHIQPFWFYVPIILLGISPWLVLLPALFTDVLKTLRSSAPVLDHDAYLWISWFVFPLIFFSASKSKLPGYILPALFPLLLLIVKSVALRLDRTPPGNRWIGLASGFAMMATAAFVGFFSSSLPFAIDYFPPRPLGWLLLVLMALAIVAAMLGSRKKSRLALSIGVFGVITSLQSFAYGDARWALDKGVSAGFAGSSSQEVVSQFSGTQVYIYKLRRSFRYSLNFYFHRELPDWNSNDQASGFLFAAPSALGELRNMGWSCPTYIAYPAVVTCKGETSFTRPGSGRKPQ